MSRPVMKAKAALFEYWVKEAGNVERVLELIADGMTLTQAGKAVDMPYRLLHAYFHSTPEREKRYVEARKAWADRVQDEAKEIADAVKADRDEVAKAKLQVEVREAQAKAYYQDRWGERLKVDRGLGGAAVDAALLGAAGELLKLVREKPEVKVEKVVLPALEDGTNAK